MLSSEKCLVNVVSQRHGGQDERITTKTTKSKRKLKEIPLAIRTLQNRMKDLFSASIAADKASGELIRRGEKSGVLSVIPRLLIACTFCIVFDSRLYGLQNERLPIVLIVSH